MPERRLLALSYAFPPLAFPEAAVSAKRLAHIPRWRADVVAAARFHPKIAYDDDLLAYAEANVRSVKRVAPPWPDLWRVLGLVSRIPDAFRLLNGRVVAAAQALGPGNFAAMLSCSQYHSIHLAARRIKSRHPNLPWIAHFSDPWIDNPFVRLSGVERAINRTLERSVVEGADRVVFTTPETLDLVMAKYPSAWRGKARMIPHGFEPSLYGPDQAPPTGGRRIILRYIGNFYGHRTPEPLYRALGAALARRASLAGEIAVEIVGEFQRGLRQAPVPGTLPEGLVTIRPSVGYRESLRLMRSADLLLVVDAPATTSVFLPSKLVDYLGAGKPIVGFTPPGASARILRETGNFFADVADVDAGAGALLAAIDSVGRHQAKPCEASQRYSVLTTGAELATVLDELLN